MKNVHTQVGNPFFGLPIGSSDCREVSDGEGAVQSQDVTWMNRAAIGAVGGITLALLKLIEAKFYIDDIGSKIAIAAYCTYVAYIALGMIAAVFLSESDVPSQKIRKSAFVTGLLAPTILVALMTQPPTLTKGGIAPTKELSMISGLFVSEARAQQVEKKELRDAPTEEKSSPVFQKYKGLTILRKVDLEPSFGEALLIALGRDRPIHSYMYVLGYSDDFQKASVAANSVNKLWKGRVGEEIPNAKVVKIEGNNKFYVTLGGANSLDEVSGWRTTVHSAILSEIFKNPAIASTPSTKLILDGQVVDGRQLGAADKQTGK